ncbi:major facilitator superfamily transporter permease [Limosilactobacillus coleohominis DSM 14060]|nr:major facilitator superfamily transporter permease [Limosilactobacillus coleohominis DSM 14060]
MLLLPNSGSFGFGYGSLAALWFGAITVAFLDLSSNVAMQPFKMMVGDMVNDDQKSYAYGVQSFLSNTGAVLAAIFPFLLTLMGVANKAPKGVVPQSVIISFYVGAALLVITSLFTIFRVHEYDPATYAKYHGISEADNKEGGNWYGVLAAVQSIAAVIWSYVLAKVPNKYHKLGYAGSLLLGAIGFISVFYIHDKWTLIISYTLVGIAWAGMNTYPLTIVTNALSGKHMGTYLGLFNGSICLPQIVASLLSFVLFPMLGGSQVHMFLLGGVVMILAALSVGTIHETYVR